MLAGDKGKLKGIRLAFLPFYGIHSFVKVLQITSFLARHNAKNLDALLSEMPMFILHSHDVFFAWRKHYHGFSMV